MKCPCCNEDIDARQMDLAFGLPDVIFALTDEQREVRAKIHSDLCSIDDQRYFIRGVVYVPVTGLGSNFGWGVWAEVSKDTFFKYYSLYDKDGSEEPASAGVLANTPPGYDACEQALEIRFGPSDKRPVFIPMQSDNEFYHEYAHGLPIEKWHTIISRYML